MDRFSLTQSKLLNQPPARRHKLVCQWLRSIYLEQQSLNTIPESAVDLLKSYQQVLSWMNEPDIEAEDLCSIREWLELLSDRYRYHKLRSGIGQAEHNLLPKVQTGDKLHDGPWVPALEYKVALDNFRSAFNVGSVFRTVDAVGFENVIIGGSTPGNDHQQVIKTAMKCTDWIPQTQSKVLEKDLTNLKNEGYTIIGIETIETSCSYLEYQWPPKGVVVLGNEEYGLSTKVINVCDTFVHLPMRGRKNSINVANAFAVIAFEIAYRKR